MSKNFGYKNNNDQKKQRTRINEYIRVPNVLVIKDNQKLGVFTSDEARRMAREAELDLVEIVPHAKPPVCRIMDYGKWKYEQAIKEKEQRKQQKSHGMKNLKLSPAIGDHDLNLKIQQARGFIEEGQTVHFNLRYKARQNAHKDLGFLVMEKIMTELKDVGTPQYQPKLEGNCLNLIIDPIK